MRGARGPAGPTLSGWLESKACDVLKAPVFVPTQQCPALLCPGALCASMRAVGWLLGFTARGWSRVILSPRRGLYLERLEGGCQEKTKKTKRRVRVYSKVACGRQQVSSQVLISAPAHGREWLSANNLG